MLLQLILEHCRAALDSETNMFAFYSMHVCIHGLMLSKRTPGPASHICSGKKMWPCRIAGKAHYETRSTSMFPIWLNNQNVDLPSGGSRISRRGACICWGGHGPLMRVLFGENVCKSKELGPIGGGVRPARPPLDPPMLPIVWFSGMVLV